MICRPTKKSTINNITQYYGVNPQPFQPTGHTGIDIAYGNCYGDYLVAPEDVEVISLIDAENISPDLAPLSRGYGILMRSINNPSITHLYWHCLPVFSCVEGDVLEQGEICGQIGNSGFVMMSGQIVPISDRLKPPYYGSHLHQEMKIDCRFVNPLDYIDWNIEVQGVGLTALEKIINNLLKLFR